MRHLHSLYFAQIERGDTGVALLGKYAQGTELSSRVDWYFYGSAMAIRLRREAQVVAALAQYVEEHAVF
jgi:hypothetical protein